HFARFSGTSRDRAVEGRNYLQIVSIGLRFFQTRAGLFRSSFSRSDVRLRLNDLLADGQRLRRTHRRVGKVRSRDQQARASGIDLSARSLNGGGLRFGSGTRLAAGPLRHVAVTGKLRVALLVVASLFVLRLFLDELRFGFGYVRLGLTHASLRV